MNQKNSQKSPAPKANVTTTKTIPGLRAPSASPDPWITWLESMPDRGEQKWITASVNLTIEAETWLTLRRASIAREESIESLISRVIVDPADDILNWDQFEFKTRGERSEEEMEERDVWRNSDAGKKCLASAIKAA